MAKSRLHFELDYSVNKASLESVSKALKQIQTDASTAKYTGKLTKELEESAAAASKLQNILDDAWNSNLGQLNLDKVNKGIKTTYGSVSDLKRALTKSGAAGVEAYEKMATQILNTNLQLKKSSKLLDDMAVSMKNTIQWGITSSIMNKFTGSIQEAWGYTKRLDESLTNIRIVTGKNTEEMQAFAKTANDAAKALSAGTVDYTDASLIYYQQGLSDEEALARTNTTIKMANVLGESASEISNYMTAVWNNFASGSEEIETFADKIAALGAATAASSEEIATGLEKFAAVAESTGLSYDYATSALATVVATTRQSADTVGTAFKTLFARIQGLNLGETLDDGTTLNKYSAALSKVGIDIKDQNGQLKEMDTILDEMGEKWGTLSKDSQLALAQTVAGVRQYNQLVALMDNWDFMKENLETVASATGTLNEQQETYSESLKAHLQNLRTETERTYQVMFETDSMNDFIDGISSLVENFNNFIEGMGGGTTALLHFGSIAANVFSTQIANGLQRSVKNFQTFRANLGAKDLRQQIIKQDLNGSGVAQDKQTKGYQAQLVMQQKILKVQKDLTAEQHASLLEIQKQYGANVNILANVSQAKAYLASITDEQIKTTEEAENYNKELEDQMNAYQVILNGLSAFNELQKENKNDTESTKVAQQALGESLKSMNISAKQLNLTKKEAATYQKLISGNTKNEKITEEEILALVGKVAQEKGKIKVESDKVKAAAKQLKLEENGTTEEIKEQNNHLKQQFRYLEQNAKTAGRFKMGVSGAMTAITTLTGVVGGLNEAFDESNDKIAQMRGGLSAATAVGTGVGAVIGNIIAPGVGTMVGSMLGGTLVDLIGGTMVKAEEEVLKKQEEMAQKAKERLEKSIQELEDTTAKLTSAEGNVDDWAALTAGVDEYGNNLSLTADQYRTYLDMCAEMAGLSGDLVDGYNKEGNAIITNRDAMREYVELLKQKAIEEKKTLNEKKSVETRVKSGFSEMRNGSQKDLDNIYSDRAKDTKAAFTDQLGNPLVVGYSYNIVHTEDTDFYKAGDVTPAQHNITLDEKTINKIINYASKETDKFAELERNDAGNITTREFLNHFDDIIKAYAENETRYSGGTISNPEIVKDTMGYVKSVFHSFDSTIEKAKDRMTASSASLQRYMSDDIFYGQGSEEFEGMKSGQKQIVNQAIGNIDFGTDTYGMSEEEQMKYYDEKRKIMVEFAREASALEEQTAQDLLKIQNASNFESLEQYNEFRRQVNDTLDKSGADKKTLFQYLGLSEEGYDKDLKAATDYLGKLSAQIDLSDLGVSPVSQKINELMKTSSPQELQQFAKQIQESGVAAEELSTHMLDVYINSAKVQSMVRSYEELASSIQSATTALDEFNANGSISAETIALLESTEGYEALKDIADKTSHEYLNTIRTIRQAQEAEQMDALERQKEYQLNQLAAIKEELDEKIQMKAEIDPESIDEANRLLNELAQTEYKIKLQVETDIRSDADDAFGFAKEMEQIRNMVQEDLTVTVEEAQQIIAAGYGAMLQNAKATKDGEIEISREQASAYLTDRALEVEASKQQHLNNLLLDKKELEVKREVLKQRLGEIEKALNSENEILYAQLMYDISLDRATLSSEQLTAQKQVEAQGISASEIGNINDQLFTTVTGFSADTLEEETEDMEDTVQKSAEQASKRIAHAQAIHDAYKQVSQVVRDSASGKDIGDFDTTKLDNLENTLTKEEEKDKNGGNNSGGYRDFRGNYIYPEGESGEGQEEERDTTITYDANLFKQKADESKGKSFEEANKDFINSLGISPEDFNATLGKVQEYYQDELSSTEELLGIIDTSISALDTIDSNSIKNLADSASPNKGDSAPKDEKTIKGDIDVYKEVDDELKSIENRLAEINILKKNATGQELLDLVEEENGLYDDQLKKLKEKGTLINQELANNKKELKDLGIKAQYDKDGNISNINTLKKNALDDYNAAVNTYNASGKNENDKAALDAAKEKYDRFTALVNEYYSNLSEKAKNTKEIIELANQPIVPKVEVEKNQDNTINETSRLEQIDNELKKNRIDQQNATGDELKSLVEKENELLKEQLQLRKDINKEHKKELKTAKQNINKNTDHKFRFNEDGTLANEEEVINYEAKKWEDAQKAFNNKKVRTEADEEILEKARERWEKFMEKVNDYKEKLKRDNEEELEIYELEHPKKETKEVEKLDINIYKEFEDRLEAIADKLTTVDKKKSHVFGHEHIKALQEENALLDQQLAEYESMGEIIEEEVSNTKQDLLNYDFGEGFSIEFDENGYISNYEEAANKAHEKLQAATEAYNNSDQNAYDKEVYEKAQEEFKDFQKMADKHDAAIKKKMENDQKILDANYKKIENNYKIWETTIQLELDLTNVKKEWKAWIAEMKKDFKDITSTGANDIFNIKEEFGTKDSGALKNFYTQYGALGDIDKELGIIQNGGTSEMFASETEAANAGLEQTEKVKQSGQELYNLYKNAWDTYLSEIDSIIGKWGEVINKFNDINAEIDHNIELIELLHGAESDTGAELIKQFQEVKVENSAATLEALRRERVDLEKERKALIDAGASETDADVQKLDKQLSENEKQMRTSISAYISAVTEQYTTAVKRATKEMSEALTGGTGMDEIYEEWEYQQKISDGVLTTTQKMYELNKLNGEWTKTINSSSVSAQQKLKQLQQDQLNILQDKEELTEEDIELANKQLDIVKAQMELEDARNAKKAMQLVRGSDGGWGYQYVADTDDVADKMEKLNDANYAFYETAEEQRKNHLEKGMEYLKEYNNALVDLASDTTLTQEEQAKKRVELEEKYRPLIEKEFKKAQESQETAGKAAFIVQSGIYKEDESLVKGMTEREKGMLAGVQIAGVTAFDLISDAVTDGTTALDKMAIAGETLNTKMTGENGLPNISAKGLAAFKGLFDGVAGKKGYLEKIKSVSAANNKESVRDYGDTIDKMLNLWTGSPDSIDTVITDTYDTLDKARATFDENLQKGTEKAGTDFLNFNTAIEKAKTGIDATTESVKKLGKETDSISAMRTTVDELGASWKTVLDWLGKCVTQAQKYAEILKGIDNSAPAPDASPVMGPTGPTGNVGATGSKGSNGKDGSKGRDGKNGAKGKDGKNGAKGKDGKQGPAGAVGKTGKTGPTGPAAATVKNTTTTTTKYTVKQIAELVYKMGRGDYGNGDARKKNVNKKFPNMYDLAQKMLNEALSKESYKKLYNNNGTKWKSDVVDKIVNNYKTAKKFDTGGYTGKWNNTKNKKEGKLALLHEKELVLNAKDTKNILAAVKQVREMELSLQASHGSSANGKVVANLSQAISSLQTSLDDVIVQQMRSYSDKVANLQNSAFGAFEQFTKLKEQTSNTNNNFEITMNVNGGNVDEIKKAILSLPTLASQYLAKKKP